MPPAQQVEESQQICEKLQQRFRKERPRAVAAFWPIPGEPDLRPLLTWLRKKSRLLLPRIVDQTLVFHQVEDEIELIPGPHGTREPNPTLPRLDPTYIDTILVPGLAFTEKGERLGRGGGFYDRFLSTLTERTRRIGIAFHCQISGFLPVEIHDQSVHEVVSAE